MKATNRSISACSCRGQPCIASPFFEPPWQGLTAKDAEGAKRKARRWFPKFTCRMMPADPTLCPFACFASFAVETLFFRRIRVFAGNPKGIVAKISVWPPVQGRLPLRPRGFVPDPSIDPDIAA